VAVAEVNAHLELSFFSKDFFPLDEKPLYGVVLTYLDGGNRLISSNTSRKFCLNGRQSTDLIENFQMIMFNIYQVTSGVIGISKVER